VNSRAVVEIPPEPALNFVNVPDSSASLEIPAYNPTMRMLLFLLLLQGSAEPVISGTLRFPDGTPATGWSVSAIRKDLLSIVRISADSAQAKVVVTGELRDPSGALLPGATITATNSSSGTTIETRTTRTGEYSFSSLDPGTYSFSAKLPGFLNPAMSEVQLRAGESFRVQLVLVPDPFAVSVEQCVTMRVGGVPLSCRETRRFLGIEEPGDLLTDSAGKFQLRREPGSYFVIAANSERFVLYPGVGNIAGATVVTSPSANSIEFILPSRK
jgi:hypothetical protein